MRAALLALLLALAACKTVPKAASDAGAPLFERSDVERRLRKWAPVKLEVDLSTLGEGERRALRALRAEIAALRAPGRGELLRLFDIHYGPYDQLDEQRSFYGRRTRPPGGAFYPLDLGKEAFQAHVRSVPGERAAFESANTIVERPGGKLVPAPYFESFRADLDDAAR